MLDSLFLYIVSLQKYYIVGDADALSAVKSSDLLVFPVVFMTWLSTSYIFEYIWFHFSYICFPSAAHIAPQDRFCKFCFYNYLPFCSRLRIL